MKPNRIRIMNTTTLEHNGDQCMVIRIDMDGSCSVGSIEPGESFEMNLPYGSTLTVRESVSAIHTKGQRVTENGITRALYPTRERQPNAPLTDPHPFTPLFVNCLICKLCGNGPNVAFHNV